MDRTPKLSKSSNRHNNFSVGTSSEAHICSTPVVDTTFLSQMENDDSPVHIACTQEGSDSVDVVWDWNSPQTKQKQRRPQKRLILPRSPKVPMKRHPSNNHIPNFEKLREELQSLREAMAVPDNEESLVLSPVEEADYKYVNNDHNVPPSTQEEFKNLDIKNDEDPFNDSADEDLLLCTQRIEADLETKGKYKIGSDNNLNNNNNQILKVANSIEFNKNNVNIDINKSSAQRYNFNSEKEDSFDNVLKKITIENLNKAVQKPNQTKNVNTTRFNFSQTQSENQNGISRQVGKVEFHRTQSFETTVEHTKEVIPQYKLDEIERKRKEALAKLESKRKQEYTESPSKCSPEEIEQKRLQALAKLEAKRQQEIIERKRQEALKRLEQSRKKNATIVKSSLSKRW